MHRRGGNRAHSRIVPARRRISTLSTSYGNGSGRFPHLGLKSKATPSANHVLQERQIEGKEARAG